MMKASYDFVGGAQSKKAIILLRLVAIGTMVGEIL